MATITFAAAANPLPKKLSLQLRLITASKNSQKFLVASLPGCPGATARAKRDCSSSRGANSSMPPSSIPAVVSICIWSHHSQQEHQPNN